MLAPALLDVLVCPRSKLPVIYFPRGERDQDEHEAFLLCPGSRLRYRIEEDVPVLLVDEAQELPAAEVERLVARARDLGLTVP